MRYNLAYFISFVFHPLLMPSYLFLFIMTFANSVMQPLSAESLFEVLGIIFIVTFVIPAISIGTLRLSNLITDFHLEDNKQRFTPFLFICCFYAITTYMFYDKLSISNLLVVIFFAITLLIILLTIITYYWKISVHGASIGGVAGFIFALGMLHPLVNFALILAVLMLIGGLVIYARLMLNAHTPLQVYTGVVLGFMICFFSLLFFF